MDDLQCGQRALSGKPIQCPYRQNLEFPSQGFPVNLRKLFLLVGFWRMLEVLDRHGIRCCVSLNLAVLEHYPEIAEAMVQRD